MLFKLSSPLFVSAWLMQSHLFWERILTFELYYNRENKTIGIIILFLKTSTSCNSDSLYFPFDCLACIYGRLKTYNKTVYITSTAFSYSFGFHVEFILNSCQSFQKLCWTLFTNKSNHFCRWKIASPFFVWNEFIYHKWWLPHMT